MNIQSWNKTFQVVFWILLDFKSKWEIWNFTSDDNDDIDENNDDKDAHFEDDYDWADDDENDGKSCHVAKH